MHASQQVDPASSNSDDAESNPRPSSIKLTRAPLVRILQARLAFAEEFQRADNLADFADGLARTTLPKVFNASECAIYLVNAAQDRLNLLAHGGRVSVSWHELGVGLMGRLWAAAETVRLSPGRGRAVGAKAAGQGQGNDAAARSFEGLEVFDLEVSDCQLLAVPLMKGAKVVGLATLSRVNEPFTAEDEALARELNAELGLLLLRHQTADQDRRYNLALCRLGEELQQETNEDVALRLLLAAVTSGKGLACNRAVLWLSDVDRSELRPAHPVGFLDGETVHAAWEELADRTLDEMFELARGSEPAPLQGAFQVATAELDERFNDVLNRTFDLRRPGGLVNASELLSDEGVLGAMRAEFSSEGLAAVPLLASHDRCLGVLCVDNVFDRKPIDPPLVEMLCKFARLGGLALERIRDAHEREERRTMHERLTAAIVGEADANRRVSKVLEEFRKRFGFGRWLLYYHDPKTRLARVLGKIGFGDDLDSILNFDTKAAEGAVTPRVIRRQEPYYSPHAEADDQIDREWRDRLQLKGPLLAFPICVGSDVYGVLVINDPALKANHSERLAHFENDLATAVTTVVLNQDLGQQAKLLKLIQKTQTAFVHAFADELWFLHELAFHLKNITNSSLCAIYRTSPRASPNKPLFRRVVALGYSKPEDEDEREAEPGEGNGLVNHVLAGEVVEAELVDTDKRWHGRQKAEIERTLGPFRTFLGVPLRDRLTGTQPKTVGAIVLTRKRHLATDGLAFQPADRVLVEAVAMAVSSYLALKDAWHDRDRRVTALESLRAFGKDVTPLTLASGSDNRHLFDTIARYALGAFGADVVIVCPYGPRGVPDAMSLGASGIVGDTEPLLEAFRMSDAPQRLAELGKAIYESDVGKKQDDRATEAEHILQPFIAQGQGIIAFAAIPLIEPLTGNGAPVSEVIGVLLIGYRTPHIFHDGEKLLVETFASYAALAIQSATVIQKSRQTREEAFEFFFGAVSHTLRNALGSIPGAVQYALDYVGGERLSSDQVSASLTMARDDAQRAERVMTDYQSLSHSRSGLILSPTTSGVLMTELRRIVDSVCQKERIEFDYQLAPRSSSHQLRAHIAHLGDDFRNFIKDSLRHRASEPLKISLTCCDADPEESVGLQRGRTYIKIAYRDNGPGIAYDEKQKVFDRFYSVFDPGGPPGQQRDLRGRAGLGLAIAKWHADEHGAMLLECGTPGEGVKFVLYLPVSANADEDVHVS